MCPAGTNQFRESQSFISEGDYGSETARIWDILYRDHTEDISFYLNLAKKSAPPILELGCGTGRVAIPIAEAGIEIVGCDKSKDMLDVAHSKIANLSKNVQSHLKLLEADMRRFQMEHEFGLIILPFNTFGSLLTVEDQKATLQTALRHIRDGGRLALDIINPDRGRYVDRLSDNANHLKSSGREWKNPSTGNRIVEWSSRQYDLCEQTMNETQIWEELDASNVSLKRYFRNRCQRYTFRYELQHLLAEVGFELEEVYGDFTCNSATAESMQLVFVARKPSRGS